MTVQIEQNYMAGVRTNAQMKTAIEQLLDIVNEIPGGAGTYGATVVIASDVLQVVDSFSQFIIDGQSTAADDLKAINTAGAFRDGQRVSLRIADIGRPITFKHNVAVTNKLIMLSGADYVARSINERLTFEYKESATAWYQIQPDYTELLKLLLGAQAQTTVTVTSNSITPLSADIAIANGADVTINNASRANFPNNGGLLLVTAGDANTYTLAHNVGSTGRFLNRDLASIVMKAGQSVLYRAVTSSTNCWQEVARFGFGLPTNPAQGSLYVGNGSGGYDAISGSPVNGDVPTYDTGSTNKWKFATPAGGSGGALLNGCRLSASSTLSNPANDVTGATSVYLLPHKHDKLSLYSGSGSVWNDRVITSLSLSLAAFGVARMVDIYAWDDAGTPKLEGTEWDSGGQVSYTISSLTAALPCVITTTATHAISVGDIVTITQGTSTGTAWTDTDRKLTNKFFYVSAVTGTTLTLEGVDTTSLTRTAYTNAKVIKIPTSRTTGQTRQNGVLCKTGALTRRFLGTIYIDGSGVLNDAVARRHISNVDNQELAAFGSEDTTASFTPAATSNFYARTNSTAVGVTRSEAVFALDQTIHIDFSDSFSYTAAGGGCACALGINRMLAASFSTYQGVLEFQVSAYSGNANYPIYSIYSNSGPRTFSAGLYFIQHMQYGIAFAHYGRAYTTTPLQAAVKAMILR